MTPTTTVQTSKLHWSWLGFVPLTVLVLGLDSTLLTQLGITSGQWMADCITVTYFFAMLVTLNDATVRRAMWFAVFVSAVGEVLGSMVLELWIYRNEYVPLYVPFGHAIVFGCGMQTLKLRGIHDYRKPIIMGGTLLYGTLITIMAVFWNDTLSLLLGALFALLILLNPRNRLLYMLMPVLVLYVELVGTALGCWYWPSEILGALSTTNPPVGSIVLYVILDISVIFLSSLYLSWRENLNLKSLS